jgi:hypothetical protein
MKPKQTQPGKLSLKHGQPSWRLASDTVEIFVTQLGGHMGPVTFDRRQRKIQPYSVAPWAEEKPGAPLVPLLQALRGDFFCVPFGGNATAFRGEQHPPHGETANARWKFESWGRTGTTQSLHLSLATKVRPGRVENNIFLVDGENIVYTQHVISEMRGPMNLGHHAMLRFPDEPGSGLISTSRFVYGQVCPLPFEAPEQKGYHALKTGAEFEALDKVPLLNGDTADLTCYPARRGFEDLVMLVGDETLPFAWTSVVFPRQQYVWFALRNPRLLRSTIFWISNGGRHYAPWNGRHVNVMGLEDVTSYFHFGLAESARPNPLSRRGFPTAVQLNKKQPLAVPYIMGIAPLPKGFNRVQQIEAAPDRKSVAIYSANGKKVTAAVAVDFLDH